MSTFAERVAQKQASTLPPCETVQLEDLGEAVVVRALMAGAMLRVNAEGPATQGLAVIAFATETPERPGEPAWNWNDVSHRQQIEKLSVRDMTAIVNAHNRLTGETESDAVRLGKSEGMENGSISSPPVSASPPVNSENG